MLRDTALRRLKDCHEVSIRGVELSVLQEPWVLRPDLGAGPLSEALDELPVSDREIPILRHVSELSFREISETVQLGLSVSKMRLYGAESRLRSAGNRRRQTRWTGWAVGH